VNGYNRAEVQRKQEGRQERYRAGRSYVWCAGEGGKVVLAFPYNAAMVGEAKAISGRHFDWNTKTNVYPFIQLPQVIAFADAHGIDVAPHVRALIPAAARHAGREPAANPGQSLRQAAHFYLDHCLQPVPAWAAEADGACRCPRGAACARPGKHPRSVRAGPGPHAYSWKPLACATHEEVEWRFGSGGEYARANLMVAIPEGILVIDQDYDDGGRHAVAALAAELGGLPATLSHDTPHGRHLIYRTPPGWTTRAWVGKDHRNPLPAGIDLRVPGQILMAPPSRVPAAEGLGLVGYGPVSGTALAELPASYLDAWTPPKEQARSLRPRSPVPPGRADAAASYVNARINGITQDLAALKPGGRNTAIYTAALKVGSTLGAARSTPGVEQAAAAWTDEAAEEALLDAAGQNGYVADHSAAAARSAIRSGLRNGLRNPRPLPDFANHSRVPGVTRQMRGAPGGPGTDTSARPPGEVRDPGASQDPGSADSVRLPAVSGHPAGRTSGPKEAESGGPEDLLPRHGIQAGAGDWREAIVQKGRADRQPACALPGSEPAVAAEITGVDIGG
jgi:hypothetical protein